MNEVPIERVRELLRYEPMEHGSSLVWIKDCANAIRKGTPAGGVCRVNGYGRVRIARQLIPAHRIVWALHYGEWPKYSIDHINRNRADNRIENLRLAHNNQADNAQNRSKNKNNKSGFSGVHFDAKRDRWIASISVNKRQKYLGSFLTPEEAHKVYLEAKQLLHPFAVMDNGNNSE